MAQWKPIETAPKTDTPILVCWDNGDVEVVDDSHETDWQPYDGVNETLRGISKPTHWMPIPALPKTIKEGRP